MASKLVRSAVHKITKVPTGKSLAAPLGVTGPNGLQVTRLRNGTIVGTVDSTSPLARVSVFVRAGTRYDTVPGISHVTNMAIAQEMGAKEYTAYNMIRTRHHSGATLECALDREMAIYTMTNNKDKVLDMVSHLHKLTSNVSRLHYEFNTKRDITRMRATIAIGPREKMLDMAVKAAYRAQPLGNSLYVPDYNIGKISHDQVNEFVGDTHGRAGLVVMASGLSQEDLEDKSDAFGLLHGCEQKNLVDSKYYGGDLRLQTAAKDAHVIVLAQGAKMCTAESLACRVAAEALATKSLIYGSNCNSPLVRALKGAPVTVEGIALSYSDSGLFGFTLHAYGADAPQAVTNCVAAAKSYKATDKDVAGAKARVAMSLMQIGDKFGGIQDVGSQVLLTGTCISYDAAVKMLESVDTAAVNKALSSLKGKLTVAAVGDINEVPYADSL